MNKLFIGLGALAAGAFLFANIAQNEEEYEEANESELDTDSSEDAELAFVFEEVGIGKSDCTCAMEA